MSEPSAKAKLDATIHDLKTNTDPSRKEPLTEQFWRNTVAWFNEEMAGTVTLADGRTHTIPPI